MAPRALTEEQAHVLQSLGNPDPHKPLYRTRKDLGLADLAYSVRVLAQLKKAGLAEDKKLGARAQGWRLTDAGVASLPAAAAVLEAAKQVRLQAWASQNQVYGVPRPADAPALTPLQQRAWMRGFVQAQLRSLPLPQDAPAEVQANYEGLLAWMERLVAPHRPFES